MAAILRLLQTIDPRTRQYIRYFKISEIYEVNELKKTVNVNHINKMGILKIKSLISGIVIVQPDDAVQWLIDKLELLHTVGIKELKWLVFFYLNYNIYVAKQATVTIIRVIENIHFFL